MRESWAILLRILDIVADVVVGAQRADSALAIGRDSSKVTVHVRRDTASGCHSAGSFRLAEVNRDMESMVLSTQTYILVLSVSIYHSIQMHTNRKVQRRVCIFFKVYESSSFGT